MPGLTRCQWAVLLAAWLGGVAVVPSLGLLPVPFTTETRGRPLTD